MFARVFKGFMMLRRAYLLNLVVSAIGMTFCWISMPSTTSLIEAGKAKFEAAARDSVFLGPLIFRTITVYGRE